jgi:hypothetical protein
MADNESPQGKDLMTPEEFQGWLKQEIRDSAKAHELRVKDATAFVTAYSEGKLTPEEAEEHLYRYDRRWGEALCGTMASPGTSDEAILRAIDKARDEMLGKHTARLSSMPPETDEHSR